MSDMVSIIIPVYNVEKYIDRCLNSVVSQTYKDIEILIMEGQSTDESLKKVKKWASKDERIQYVSRVDGGLGSARDYAVEMASGEWLLFVDSDDWIAEDFVEKCVGKIDIDVDIVIGNAKRIRNDNIVDNIGDEWLKESIEDEKDKIDYVCYASNFVWGKLIRKSFYKKCQIKQPKLPFEDLAIFPTLILKANKMAICHEALAYYEASREGALSQQLQTYKHLDAVYEYAKTLLEKNGIAERYEKILHFSFYLHGRIICIYCLGFDNYKRGKFDYKTKIFLDSIRPDGVLKRLFLYGGFTLRWTVQHMCCGDENINGHIPFSNIISQMNLKCKKRHLIHENAFRNRCLNDDINSKLQQYIEDEEIEALLIDFTNELQDVLISEEGDVFTFSEPLREALKCEERSLRDIFGEYRIVNYGSNEWIDLWRQSCKLFVEWINNNDSFEVVLVKNRFANRYQSAGEWYEYEDSTTSNRCLEELYDYFLSLNPRCMVYEPNEKLMYTDMTGKDNYEKNSEYMNTAYYKELARRIQTGWMFYELENGKTVYEQP